MYLNLNYQEFAYQVFFFFLQIKTTFPTKVMVWLAL